MPRLDPNEPRFARVSTPALVLDVAALDANIAWMAEAARAARLSLRPHAKTHKSPDVARRQRAAGAVGISCATLLEAEDMASAGLDNLLITSPVVGSGKATRLASLHRRTSLMATVDHPAQVDAILAALGPQDLPLALLVDVDIGQGRTGVAAIDDGLSLARRIRSEARLRFAGLQAYAGHVQHIVEAAKRLNAARQSEELVRSLSARLKQEGLPPEIVSGSGTGASAFDLETGPYSELQVGSYVFMDADYGSIKGRNGERLPFDNSLFVLATVVSTNRPGQVTVDAGTKALAVNGPPPDRLIGVPEGSAYSFWGDEHGTIRLPPGAAAPRLGARILIGATHCDPTVNLHSHYHAAMPDGTLAHWPIVGRYR
jgi:D-serine deaminase-like pyridoxal phosphate-dependent protein